MTTPELKARRRTLKDIVAEYGVIALLVYLIVEVIVVGGAWIAMRAGWRSPGNAGTVAALVVVHLATKPIRWAATIVLTPLAARVYERARRIPPADPHAPDAAPDEPTDSESRA